MRYTHIPAAATAAAAHTHTHSGQTGIALALPVSLQPTAARIFTFPAFVATSLDLFGVHLGVPFSLSLGWANNKLAIEYLSSAVRCERVSE